MTKKLLYLCTALGAFSLVNAQNLIAESFDDMTVTLGVSGWVYVYAETSPLS
jgi:hypothetical protein